ncbi:unnamed protein product [Dimorphilus gyrociliatus]|uniref:Uncharacterized protein n=1 Tax=Dimorphilus gyrociliatus TaxID=2664684 RepID=A0A7I8W8E5_9ANNE|nr:unnamed protein product [Dimorphilus gyrociliatus]
MDFVPQIDLKLEIPGALTVNRSHRRNFQVGMTRYNIRNAKEMPINQLNQKLESIERSRIKSQIEWKQEMTSLRIELQRLKAEKEQNKEEKRKKKEKAKKAETVKPKMFNPSIPAVDEAVVKKPIETINHSRSSLNDKGFRMIIENYRRKIINKVENKPIVTENPKVSTTYFKMTAPSTPCRRKLKFPYSNLPPIYE